MLLEHLQTVQRSKRFPMFSSPPPDFIIFTFKSVIRLELMFVIGAASFSANVALFLQMVHLKKGLSFLH